MTERTAVPERVSQRARTARRRGGLGSQAVGDYVGQPAGEAAQAVRRAGLRPGLDRSFGAPAELIGLVVAQDPVAGSDLARNGMVTLYVAAPGDEPPGSDADTAATASGEPDEKQAAPEPIEDAPSPLPAMPVRARRRRKPGHAHRSAALSPPPPAPAVEATPPAHSPVLPAVEPPAESPVAPDDALDEDELADELGEREFPHEDFVVHVEDVLAGRSGPPWRRAYPRRRARHRLGEQRSSACMVGRAPAARRHGSRRAGPLDRRGRRLNGGPPRAHSSANAVAPSHAPSTRRPGPVLKPAAAQSSTRTRRRPARRACTRTRREWHAARPRRIPRRAPGSARPAAPAVRETVAPPPREAPAPQPSEAPTPTPTAASAPPAAAPEQRGGGLFSP